MAPSQSRFLVYDREVFLLACTAGEPGFGTSGNTARPEDTDAPPLGAIVWREELGRDWACPEPYLACVEDYLALPGRLPGLGTPITEEELADQFDALVSGEVEQLGAELTEAELGEVILDALTPLDALLYDGLDERPLTATVVSRVEYEGYTEEQIVLEDPYVGEVLAWLLVPDEAVDSAILPLHGHDQWGDSVLDFMGGRDYPAAGYLTLNVTFRIDGADEYEDEVARALLLEGYTLMSIRIYEQVLARRILADRFEDIEHVGIVGHSGSSAATNLAIRVHPPDAYVSDLKSDYDEVNGGVLAIDQALPALHPYADRINDLEAAEVPVLTVPYGYEDEQDEIIAFFDSTFQR